MTEAPNAPVEGQGEGQAAPAQNTWYDGASDEIKGLVQNKKWDSPVKALEAYHQLEKFVGAPPEQIVKLPKDLSDPSALEPIYNKLGRPESPDKYEIKLPDGVQVDENRLKQGRELAHKLGLNPKQFQELVAMDAQYYQQTMESTVKEQQEKATLEAESLKKEWGNAYDERRELARRALRSNLPQGADGDAILESLEKSAGLANTLKLLANIGSKIGEDKAPNAGAERQFGYSPEQAKYDKQQLMDELKGDKARLQAYNEGKGADYTKMQRLNSILVGVK